MRKVLHFLCMHLKSQLEGWILLVEMAMRIVNSICQKLHSVFV